MNNSFFDKVRALILAVGSLLLLICIQIAGIYAFALVCKLMFGVNYSDNPVLMAVFHIIYAIVTVFIFGMLRRSYTAYGTMAGSHYDNVTAVDGQQERSEKSGSREGSVLRLIILGTGIQAFAYGILNIVYEFAADTAVMESYKSTINNLNGNSTYLIFLYTMLLAPAAEELVFRGVIFDALSTAFSFMTANILQAALFGLYHGNIVQFVYAFIIGMVLGLVRYRGGKLTHTIGVHMSVNISGIIIVPVIAYVISSLTGNGVAAYCIVSLCGLIIIIEYIRKTCYNTKDSIRI